MCTKMGLVEKLLDQTDIPHYRMAALTLFNIWTSTTDSLYRTWPGRSVRPPLYTHPPQRIHPRHNSVLRSLWELAQASVAMPAAIEGPPFATTTTTRVDDTLMLVTDRVVIHDYQVALDYPGGLTTALATPRVHFCLRPPEVVLNEGCTILHSCGSLKIRLKLLQTRRRRECTGRQTRTHYPNRHISST